MVRLVALVASLLASTVLAAPAALAQERPEAVTQPATEVGPTGATLNGVVTPDGGETRYVFLYGTTRYDARTPVASAGDGDAPVAVSARIESLAPQTTYHVRLVAFGRHGLAAGADVTFTTSAGAPAPPAAPPPPVPPAAPASPTTFAIVPGGPPVLGQSVGLAVRSGTVRVKPPGATAYVKLTGAASIPVGSLVNTRAGSVTLRSALPDGSIQTGIFRGGLFEVRQANAMTELVLRGAMPACPRGRASAAATRRRKPPRRRLWGRDERGNFRTRGGNSVATVRGTAWYVEDRCDGTLTRVSAGRVSVYDKGRRVSVVVRAGRSYLARAQKR